MTTLSAGRRLTIKDEGFLLSSSLRLPENEGVEARICASMSPALDPMAGERETKTIKYTKLG